MRKDELYVDSDWSELYLELKAKGYSLSKISTIIGTQFRRNVYKKYAMPISSLRRLEKLLGHKVHFSYSELYEKFKLIPSQKLAEFIGILLGDGNLTRKQISIALNSRDDWYVKYVRELCIDLFRVPVQINRKKKENVIYVRINRTGLIEELGAMGLQCGDKIKNNWHIPLWITPKYWHSCIKGLFDTDGSIYWQTQRTLGTAPRPAIKFTSMNQNFLNFFEMFCKSNEITISPGQHSWQIQSASGVHRFQELVSSEKISHFN